MRWAAIAFFSFLDLILAGVLTFIDNRTDKIFLFLMGLAVLWVLPLLIGFWSLIKFWIGYRVFSKRKMVRHYKAQMHKHKFPSAAAFVDSMSYLSGIMDDEAVDAQTKLKAAFFVGELSTYREMHPMTFGFAADMAFQQAMEEYKP